MIIALVINLLFLFSCILLGNLDFGAMDDYFMATILSGAHGTSFNPHLYFVNALYGYALIPFYHILPKINWYYIAEMFGTFLSYTVVSYIIVQKAGKYFGSILTCTLLLFTCKHFYLSVQFTQCAALFTATGMATCLYSINEKKTKLTILGGGLVFWGSLMRWEAFLMGFPFLAISILVQFRICLKNWKLLTFVATSLFLFIGAANLFNNKLYETNDYKTYKEYQGPRAAFGDGNNYDKQAAYEDLEEDGMSGEDFIMLTQWKFYDTEIFSTKKMEKFLEYTHKYKNKISVLQSPIQILGNLSNSIKAGTCFAFFIFGIFVLVSNPKYGGYPWFALLTVLLLMAYLQYLNRNVLRVENGFWIYAAILAIPLWKPAKTIPNKFLHPIICILFAANIYSLWQIPAPQTQKETYRKVFAYIAKHPNTMFLFSMPQYEKLPANRLPVYYAEPIGSLKQIVSLGYWTAYLPDITQNLKAYGITNPIKDMVHNNIIVVGDASYQNFLQRHYYKNVSIDTVLQIDKVYFYKYTISETP